MGYHGSRWTDMSTSIPQHPLPTLVVETLSRDDGWAKVIRRLSAFLERGVAVVWVVDPEGRSVTVHRPNQLTQVFEGDDELTGDPELPGFRCRVAEMFILPGEEEANGPVGQGGTN
jgi:Uma2 family endonuclease